MRWQPSNLAQVTRSISSPYDVNATDVQILSPKVNEEFLSFASVLINVVV